MRRANGGTGGKISRPATKPMSKRSIRAVSSRLATFTSPNSIPISLATVYTRTRLYRSDVISETRWVSFNASAKAKMYRSLPPGEKSSGA
jgi:hypothetical protein